MPLYRRKPPEIEAHQWTGDTADVQPIQTFLGDVFVGTTGTSPDLVLVMQSAFGSGTVDVPPGHMVLLDEQGQYLSSDPTSFAQVFEPSP